MSQAYLTITDSVRANRRRVDNNDDRQTNTMKFLLIEATDLHSSLNYKHHVN